MRRNRPLHALGERGCLLRRDAGVGDGGRGVTGKAGGTDRGDDHRRGQEVEDGTPGRDDVVLPTVGRALVVQHEGNVRADFATARVQCVNIA